MRIVAGLLAILLVIGCSDKGSVPSGILPREEMEKVLWDMVQADQYATLYLVKDSARINVKTETQKLYEEVFRLHKISREDFRKSFQYYQEHPVLTRNVFDSILAQGNRSRQENYTRPVLPAKPAVTTQVTPAPGTPVITPNRLAPGSFKPPAPITRPPLAKPAMGSSGKPAGMTAGKPLIIHKSGTDTTQRRHPK